MISVSGKRSGGTGSAAKGSVAVCAGDVSKQEDAEAMVKATVEFGGKIDVLVNNAHIDPAGTVVDIPVEQWQSILNVNLNGPFYLMRAAIPYDKNGGGSIVNIVWPPCGAFLPCLPIPRPRPA